jgi:hypothetical protein
MALHTLALTGTLPCLAGWMMPTVGAALTPADLAAIDQGAVDDSDFGSLLQGLSYGAQAVIATGNTNGTTALASVAKRAGAQYPLPITQIRVGDLVLGTGIAPGTFVSVVAGGGATITMSKAATGTATGGALAFLRPGFGQFLAGPTPFGQLFIPARGTLKILPGDVVVVDPVTGWPFLVSAAAIATPGSPWTFT